jgi:hypothetical protein
MFYVFLKGWNIYLKIYDDYQQQQQQTDSFKV